MSLYNEHVNINYILYIEVSRVQGAPAPATVDATGCRFDSQLEE